MQDTNMEVGIKNRRRLSRTQWLGLIHAYEEGKESQVEFCDRHGGRHSTFCKLRKRLREERVEFEMVEPFVELSAVSTLPVEASWRVELDLGNGMILRVK